MEACRVRYANSVPGIVTSRVSSCRKLYCASWNLSLADAQMKHISFRMAEASIKFDLLSVDPKCQVYILTV